VMHSRMAWQADIFRRKVEPSSAADRSGSRLTQVEDWDRFRLRAAVAPDSVQMPEQRSALVLGLKSTDWREMHLASLPISATH